MSVDLFVHSQKSDPVSKSAVQASMRELGWDVVFIEDWYRPSPASSTSLADGELAIGWRSDPDIASRVQSAILDGNRQELERLYDALLTGTCAISIDPPEVEDDEERFPDDVLPAYRQAYEGSKLCYYLRTSAGRSPLAYDLQFALWQAIGVATSGLLEDPQTGERRFSHEPFELPDSSSPEALRKYAEYAVPWWALEWYGALSAVGLLFLVTRRLPTWMSVFLLVHGVFAYGFYRGWRWMWLAVTTLSMVVVGFGLIMLFAGEFRPYLIPPILFYGYLLFRLLSPETRVYFEG